MLPTSARFLGGGHWASIIPEMYVWLDYLSVPQPLQSCGASHPAEITDTFAAINSIPCYVHNSTYFGVVCPETRHLDRNQLVNYGTWLKRGWCNLECLSQHLFGQSEDVIVFLSEESAPFFSPPWDSM